MESGTSEFLKYYNQLESIQKKAEEKVKDNLLHAFSLQVDGISFGNLLVFNLDCTANTPEAGRYQFVYRFKINDWEHEGSINSRYSPEYISAGSNTDFINSFREKFLAQVWEEFVRHLRLQRHEI